MPKTMNEFEQLEKDLEPIFAEIQQIKERYRITSLSLDSFALSDQFHGNHGGSKGFMARREFRHRRNNSTKFKKIT